MAGQGKIICEMREFLLPSVGNLTKPESKSLIVKTMKITTKIKILLTTSALSLAGSLSGATIAIEQNVSAPIQDGSNLNYSFSVSNTSSVLVAGLYDDSNSFGNILYGGDSPDGLVSNNRTHLAYWLNPNTGSANFTQTGISSFNPGMLLGILELSNVDLSAVVTSSTGSSITTPTNNEFVVSFSGNNGDGSHGPTASSIIGTPLTIPSYDTTATSVDDPGNPVGGGGSVAGGTGLAGLAGSQNVSWDSGDVVNFSFQAVPEPSAFALIAGFLGLTWIMVRRRS